MPYKRPALLKLSKKPVYFNIICALKNIKINTECVTKCIKYHINSETYNFIRWIAAYNYLVKYNFNYTNILVNYYFRKSNRKLLFLKNPLHNKLNNILKLL